jgi:hypothetical protein
MNDAIGVSTAAKMLRRDPRTIRRLCKDGDFKTAHKPGKEKLGWWMISRLEVVERKHVTSLTAKYLL